MAYWVILGFGFASMALFYVLGVWATLSRSIKLMDVFNLICLVDMLSQMVQAYIQRFNPVSFFARLVCFLFSKYLCDQLIKLVLLLY